jgi:hypothetical protein
MGLITESCARQQRVMLKARVTHTVSHGPSRGTYSTCTAPFVVLPPPFPNVILALDLLNPCVYLHVLIPEGNMDKTKSRLAAFFDDEDDSSFPVRCTWTSHARIFST